MNGLHMELRKVCSFCQYSIELRIFFTRSLSHLVLDSLAECKLEQGRPSGSGFDS